MLRVLMITPHFPPAIQGGLGRQAGDLARNIASTLDLGVIAPSAAWDVEGVRLFPFEQFGDMLPDEDMPSLLRMNIAMQSAAIQALTAGTWDIIHAHDWAIAPASSQIAQATGIPMITTIHAENGGKLGGSAHDRVRRLAWEQVMVAASDVVTAVSEPLARSLRDRYPSSDVRAIPNGIVIPQTPRDSATANPHDILFVGRLVPHKGVQDVIRAMPAVLDAFADVRLRIVGDGFYREDLQQLTVELQLQESIEFTGWLDGDSLQAAYNRSGLLVAPSHEEAFGLVVAEGMAAGVPVVASDCPAFRALIDAGVTGRLFRTGDAEDLAAVLIDALRHNDAGAAMAAAAKKRIMNSNSWPVIGETYLDLYREVAG